MRMGSQNQICTIFQKNLCPLFLHIIWCQPIFCSPVWTHDCKICQFFCSLNVCSHLLLIQQIHRIRHIRWKCDSIGSICIVQNSNLHIRQLYNWWICATGCGGFFRIMNSKDRDLWILLFPMFHTVYKSCTPFVHGMIRCMTDHIKTCIH